MSSSKKELRLTSREEEEQIARSVMIWLNIFQGWPVTVPHVKYEYLSSSAPCIAMSAIQGAYITKRYITGGHQAEYQFKIIYRIHPLDEDNRLKADELLDRFGAWAAENLPDLGESVRATKVEATTRASLFAAYDGGDEDHQILLKMTYEVI